VVRTKNDLVVTDVHDGDLYGSILSTGLTQEELARIQLPSIRIRPARSIANAAPARPIDVAVNGVPTEEQMRAQLRAQFARIKAELVEASDRSLDVAVERLLCAGARGQYEGGFGLPAAEVGTGASDRGTRRHAPSACSQAPGSPARWSLNC
jgi:hypothetical protein